MWVYFHIDSSCCCFMEWFLQQFLQKKLSFYRNPVVHGSITPVFWGKTNPVMTAVSLISQKSRC